MTINNCIYRIILTIFSLCICVFSIYAENNYTIVIDAGHGGKDPGAIDNGVKEKDINLNVALFLGDMIKKHIKDINVVYTRDKDTYLTLQQRANKANKSKADIFISIHVNSVDKTNKNRSTIAGASVYTLGVDKNDENISVAQRENSVISLESNYETKYQGFNPESDESYIIFEMAQKDNLNQSIILANNIQQQLVNVAKRKDRGVHQAGFWVLWATSMPAVLVELDFICNPNSAKYIASTIGQKKLAEGIFNAVKTYFEQLTNGALQCAGDSAVEPMSADNSIVLEATSVRKSRSVNAPTMLASDRQQTQKRRRRSEISRQVSANREIEIAVIGNTEQIEVQETDLQSVVDAEQFAMQNEIELANNETLQMSEIEEQTVVSANNENVIEEQNVSLSIEQVDEEINFEDVKYNGGQKHRRRSYARLNSYYTIKLFESTEHLLDNDPLFDGLKSVKIKEGESGQYIYICGEYNTKSEVTKILNKVINKFPKATIIRLNKGTNKIIN